MNGRTQSNPRQWEEALRWLVFADDDLRAVDTLMAAASPPFRSAAFHCQQAAEKMAKATLVALGDASPKIHDLEELSGRVGELDPEMGGAIGKLANLTTWYMTARYPDMESDLVPSAQDIRSALTDLRALRQRIDLLAPQP